MIQFINKPENFNQEELKTWLILSARFYQVIIEKLVYSFVTKEKMLDLNMKYLNHNTQTDIITFSYGTKANIISEVYISLDQATENAIIYKQSIDNEIIRLVSHGFLHSIGFSDKTIDKQDKMTKEEDKMIDMFHVKHIN